MNEHDQQPAEYDPYTGDGVYEPIAEPVADSYPDDSPQSFTDNAPQSVIPTSVYCIQCGYNLTGIAIGSTCPECGRAVAPSFHGQTLPMSGLAVASMVLGIVSIAGCVFYGLPSLICGPLAIIFSRLVQRQINEGRVSTSSKGMAIAGLICGIVGICLALLGIGFIVVAITLG